VQIFILYYFCALIIYLDNFWCIKILASKYICENGKKKREKKKRKDFLANWAGGILAQKAQARAGGRAFGPLGPAARGDGGGTALRRGPARQREGGNSVNGTEGGARARPGAGRRRAPRRFSAVGPVLRWGNGGGAWAVDGGHGGGANFACGGLWWPVRGTAAGAHGGDASGEVAGHNSVGEVASRDRESVAELLA
jgi:hypothetical protein